MRRLRLLLLVAATVAPLAALVANVIRCGLPFPFWDAWLLTPLLEADRQGRLALADLWELHNGHRLLVPKALMVALARASGWNVAWELTTSVVLAILCGAVLAWLVGRHPATARARWWLLPALSTLLFSWAQMENWIWGWQLQVFLCLTAAVTAVAALSRSHASRAAFLAAVVLALVASCSFAAGLVVWVAALPLLIGTSGARTRIALWSTAGAATIVVYFAGAEGGPAATITGVLRSPVALVHHLLISLGSPVSSLVLAGTQMNTASPEAPLHTTVATLTGLIGVGAAVGLVAAGRRRRLPWAYLASWFALCLLGAGAAGLTSLGRADLGLSQALASRYTTLVNPFWWGVLGLGAVVRPQLRPSRESPRALPTGALAVLCLVIGMQVAELRAGRCWERFSAWRRLAFLSLRVGNLSPVFASQLFANGEELVATYVPIVARHGLAGFNTPPRVSPATVEQLVTHARTALTDGQPAVAQAYLRTALTVAPDHPGALALVAGREAR